MAVIVFMLPVLTVLVFWAGWACGASRYRDRWLGALSITGAEEGDGFHDFAQSGWHPLVTPSTPTGHIYVVLNHPRFAGVTVVGKVKPTDPDFPAKLAALRHQAVAATRAILDRGVDYNLTDEDIRGLMQ